MKEYDFAAIEKKWQKKWEDENAFAVKEDSKKKKFYELDMFPYPSGAGLHMGHAFVFSLGDINARLKRLQGYNVLYPIGYDSLGLPAEQAAIKAGVHPEDYTAKSIANFMKQQKAMGWSYDWNRLLKTHDEKYYKWDQWIFLKMLEKGIAFRKKASVNWCSKCQSVLANEQVVNGKCWRHEDTNVEVKPLEQWFLKITKYAEELLSGLDKLQWPENAKVKERNWIGRSEGSEILFDVNGERWPIFTTRADTLMGVTFLVVSAQHPRLMELTTKEQKKDVEAFVKKIRSTSEKDAADLEKEGVFTGSYAKHPLTGEKVPIWAGNFVLADYGSGMVMAVPAHDQRDFDFAKKYNIPIKVVIEPVTGTVRENEEYRRSIVAVVENKEGKVLSINWGDKLGGNLFIGGGMEKGEEAVQTAIREIREETGYKNVKFISQSETIHHHYFAHSKNVARNIDATGLYFRLENDEKASTSLASDEKGKFKVEWISKEDAARKVKDELHSEVFKRLVLGQAGTSYGILTNSSEFNGLESEDAIMKITNHLESMGLGKRVVQYKLRDWLISRQRYWGTPIPIVYCDKCGAVPVPEKDLPVKLPKEVVFGKGNPLETNKKFIETKCPKCKGKARRETDTMDTFANSSWYFLRYTDPENENEIFSTRKANYWAPIDQYIGGPEHICMHLIYVRFYTKFLRDIGLLKFDEPALRYFTNGIVHGPDGEKMSKSRGNVVEPLDTINQFGADSLRLYLVSNGAPESDFIWDSKGMEGAHKFVKKVYHYFTNVKLSKSSSRIESKMNKAIKLITRDVESFKHNLATIKLRGLFGEIEDESEISKKTAESFIQMMSIYCPFVCEEIWEMMGGKGFISLSSWPEADESKIDESFDKAEQAMESIASDVNNLVRLMREKQGKEVEKVYIYYLPNELANYNAAALEKRIGKEIKLFAVNDKNKYDPVGKASKAKPGKPGIYLE